MDDVLTITLRENPSHGDELAIAGELDLLSAAPLNGALAAAARGGAQVVVDAAGITFIDATGVRALEEIDRTMRTLGGRLYLVNPSAAVQRLLQLAGLSNHFPRQPAPATGSGDPLERQLREIMSELTVALLTAGSLQEDLEQLIQLSRRVLPGCTTASIALVIDGSPTTVAVSERTALELDMVQYEEAEGPCLTALDGERIRVDMVEADGRFPHFAAGIADRRVHSVLSMPIVHDNQIVGTLNFYGQQPGAFDHELADHIGRLASGQAAHAIARADVLTAARPRRDQLRARYDEALVVARAEAVLVGTQRCSAEQARNLINHAADTTGDTLLTIARRILDAARNQR